MKHKKIETVIIIIGIILLGCQNPSINYTTNSNKEILSFIFESLSVTGTITESTHTITIIVPYKTVLSALVPTITYSGVNISPESGLAQDFTNQVIYTVTAADLSTQKYSVIVIEENSLIPTNNLLAEYLFNGNINDTSGNSLHGIDKGNPLTYCKDRYDNDNSAGLFLGNNFIQGIKILSQIESSCSFWIKFTQNTDSGQLVMGLSWGSQSWDIFITENGLQIAFTRPDPFDRLKTITYYQNISIGDYDIWHHVVFVQENANSSKVIYISPKIKVYLDDVLFLESTQNGISLLSNWNFSIGGSFIHTEYCGQIDDIRIYGRVLSAQEINQLCQ